MNNLKIIHWNSNGILGKTQELQTYLRQYHTDIILLNETHLEPKHKLKIPNYFVYRNDLQPAPGSKAHGGTAVLVHRRIVHQPISLNTSLQSCSIKIQINNTEVLVSAIYKPPKAQLQISDLDTLTNSAEWTIAAGDLNAKHTLWNSRSHNHAGNILYNHIQSNDYIVTAPHSPTFYPSIATHRPDVLDIALIRLPFPTQVTNLNELSSDHNPILLEFPNNPITSTPPNTNRFINWKKYCELLSTETHDINPSINNPSEIDSAISNFTLNLHTTIEKCVTPLQRKSSRNKIPDFILREITEKNRIRREWQLTRDPNTKKILNNKTQLIKNMIKNEDQDNWDRYLDQLENNEDPNSLYKLNKSLLKKQPAKHPLLGPNGLVYSAGEKAELLADSLTKQFTPNPGPILIEVSNKAQEIKNTHVQKSNIFTTPNAIAAITKKLKKKKAPGEDQISNTALKLLPKNKILTLTKIFNCCLRISYFPLPWKRATTICIQKPKKDPQLAGSYRPIALLSSLSKVFERIILSHLQTNTANAIRNEQFAFRAYHSSTLQITKLSDNLCSHFNNGEQTAAVFLDVEKAFDRVWHVGLLYKMDQMKIPFPLIKLTESFLSDRTFIVKYEDQTSTVRKVTAGVPQGSCLSPLLFNIYTNDMPTTQKSNVSLFADDTMYYSKNHNATRAIIQVQQQLDQALEWFRRWRLKVNSTKTTAILFGHTNLENKELPKIHINGDPIEWANSVKYLGVTFNRKLNPEPHIKNIIRKATLTRLTLLPILHKKSPLSIKTKIRIWKMYILPILLYAGPAWAPFTTNTQWKRLEAVQTKVLRTITGSPLILKNSVLLQQSHCVPIRDLIKTQSKALFYKNSTSPLSHIRQIGKNNQTLNWPNRYAKTKTTPLSWANT